MREKKLVKRIARALPERKAIQVKWLEALVSFSGSAVPAGIESLPKRRTAQNSAVLQLEIECRGVLDSGIFRGFRGISRLAYPPTTRVVASVLCSPALFAVVLVSVSEMKSIW